MSGVTVSMRMSPKATGALYIKNLRNETRIEELEEELNTIRCKLPTEPTNTPCDVTNKCCNQFGERDEIQAIIDKLRADVAERDERIKELQRRLDDHAQL